MLIHDKMEMSSVNGPGERAVIWVQGCTLGCNGCWNPQTHLFTESNEVPIIELVNWVLGIPGIEGVTFSGGEPMQQAGELVQLMTILKKLNPSLSFGMYTGYTETELAAGKFQHISPERTWEPGNRALWESIRSKMDFAIMGRFNQLQLSKDKPLCGSRNQQVVFFSDRYTDTDINSQEIEMTIDEDGGLVQITGFPVGIDL